jgi:drug/metabolite transporter (DMT)-like permease
LALAAAAAYGAGDFLGGLASRRASVFVVLAIGQAVGLLGLAVATGFVPPDDVTATDVAWGAGGGVAGALGLLLLYRGLAVGRMSIVSPVTGVCGASVPVVVGAVTGEWPGALAGVGVALGLAATVLLGSASGGAQSASRRSSWLIALGAGAGFGLFFVALDRTSDESALIPILMARIASLALLAVLLLVQRPDRGETSKVLPAILAAGALDTLANVCFLLATRRGFVAVVSVITSLYPAGTVLLARAVLHERIGRAQALGLAIAAVAVVFIAA